MALSHGMTAAVSAILSIGLFAGIQLYRHQLASNGPLTILGGALSATLFMFLLTAIGNLELMLFGKAFQSSLAEVFICLVLAMAAAARIHGVCVTTCFLFSMIVVFYVSRIAEKQYGYHHGHGPQVNANTPAASHKKKNK